jgi:hypothetical protein
VPRGSARRTSARVRGSHKSGTSVLDRQLATGTNGSPSVPHLQIPPCLGRAHGLLPFWCLLPSRRLLSTLLHTPSSTPGARVTSAATANMTFPTLGSPQLLLRDAADRTRCPAAAHAGCRCAGVAGRGGHRRAGAAATKAGSSGAMRSPSAARPGSWSAFSPHSRTSLSSTSPPQTLVRFCIDPNPLPARRASRRGLRCRPLLLY